MSISSRCLGACFCLYCSTNLLCGPPLGFNNKKLLLELTPACLAPIPPPPVFVCWSTHAFGFGDLLDPVDDADDDESLKSTIFGTFFDLIGFVGGGI